MGNKASDPVDHARTTRKHAGQNIKNTAAMPGLIAVGLAVVSFVLGLFAFATGQEEAAIVAAVVAVILAIGGYSWLARERRRVRRVEAEHLRDNPDADAQTPGS